MMETLPSQAGAVDSACILTRRYEELREQWLNNQRVHKNGLSLFLDNGMAAWAGHWAACVEPIKRRSDSLNDRFSAPVDETDSKPVMTGDLVSEVIGLLATMTLRATEGVWMRT